MTGQEQAVVCCCGDHRRPTYHPPSDHWRGVPQRLNGAVPVAGQERVPASTGPMQGGWTDRTGPTLTALMRLRDETNRAMDAVQVGAPIPPALHEAWRELEALP